MKVESLTNTILCACLLSAFGVSSAQVYNATPSPVKLPIDYGRWPYPLHAEVSARMQELARKYPKRARAHNIGKSREGRDLWVIEISNLETGPGESKPGMWLDANPHPDELTGRIYLMYLVERLLATYDVDPEAKRMVDTRTFYVMPIFNVDASERILTRHPAWPGHNPDEQVGNDLNGDGYITQMRVKDDSQPDGYRYYMEDEKIDRERGGRRRRDPITGERELGDFNRNFSAEWRPDERGAGTRPFSVPAVRAMADFIINHENIFFHYNIHSGGGIRNYIVRPPMNHPYEFMPPEDNDFYVRVGAIWSKISNGGIMENNYYSFLYSTSQPDESGKQRGYVQTQHGFADDWAYMHQGLHSLTPESWSVGKDYNGDGYVTNTELLRWHEEEKGNQFFTSWQPYKHHVLGDIEIGGQRVSTLEFGFPPGLDKRLEKDCEVQYAFLMQVANLAPFLRITDLSSEKISNGEYRITAAIHNEGWLSTYVTRNAIKIQRDYPVVVRLETTGAALISGERVQNIGHILGKLAYLRDFAGGVDKSTRLVNWTIKPEGSGPVTAITVSASSPKAGQDRRTLTLE